jgi:uncharacterized membrane protein YdjX (TVP38/TMEM64 family)
MQSGSAGPAQARSAPGDAVNTPPPAGAGKPASAFWAAGAAVFLLAWLAGGLLAAPLARALHGHENLGAVLFVASSALAVVLPALSNLALVPAAVLVWGSAAVAAGLLLGWTLGSWLAFWLGRLVRRGWLGRWPRLSQVTDVDRWIQADHPMLSLVLLRMSFPVDVLSFSLGLFSARTSAWQVVLSTVLGAAPFALLFAWMPQLSGWGQLALLLGSCLVFVFYLVWVHRTRRRNTRRPPAPP